MDGRLSALRSLRACGMMLVVGVCLGSPGKCYAPGSRATGPRQHLPLGAAPLVSCSS